MRAVPLHAIPVASGIPDALLETSAGSGLLPMPAILATGAAGPRDDAHLAFCEALCETLARVC